MKNSLLVILLMSMATLGYSQLFTNQLAIPPVLTGPDFDLVLNDTTKEFLPGMATSTYGFNGADYLGPTLIFNKGETVSFDILNNTVSDNMIVHWHGMHVPPEWDGGPQSEFGPGETWSPSFEVKQNASTMFYHSHTHLLTGLQVHKGMAGLIVIKDEAESLLDLPRTYGVDDIPVALQDRKFNRLTGEMDYVPLGDTMLLNGVLNAYVDCPAQVVRFRFLNASTLRAYNIGFSDNRNFHQIGTDGGLLEAPVNLNRVSVAPGERVELLFDFRSETISNDLFLTSYSSEYLGVVGGSCTNGPGCANGPLDGTDFQFMRLHVVAPTPDPVTVIPASLVTIDWIDLESLDTTRVKQLLSPVSPGEPFTINGATFDMSVINDYIPLGNTEIWKFQNLSYTAHPMHIHDVQFNIISVNGQPPAANQNGWKDVVLVNPGSNVEVLAEFKDYADDNWAYMMHCHSLNHEDAGMMEMFLVVDTSVTTGTDLFEIDNKISIHPNPAKDRIIISNPTELAFTSLFICNDIGQKVLELKDFKGNEDLDISVLKRGMYFLYLENQNSKTTTIKFVKD